MSFENLTVATIESWLREEDHARLQLLWDAADAARKAHVGEAVHLRGLIEISSYCCRLCGYCGLRADNRGLERYRMTRDEILNCAREARELGERAATLAELLTQTDTLSVHTPLTRETRGMLGLKELSLLPKGAVVVNTARGPIVDLDALATLLKSGHLSGVGIDVVSDRGRGPTMDRIRAGAVPL